jgi:ABC-type uncharacterized transport system auxiliary subunit
MKNGHNGVRLGLAAVLGCCIMALAGCGDHRTETTQTTTRESTTVLPAPQPPQTQVTTTHTQQYTP